MTTKTPWQHWQNRHRVIKTSLGQWRRGDGVSVRGRELLTDLLHEMSLMQLIVFSVTGRCIDERLAQWLEKASFMTAYPDSRIWCNSVASIMAGEQVTPVSGLAAGLLTADSRAYGAGSIRDISNTLVHLYDLFQIDGDFDRLVVEYPMRGGVPVIPGFIRPVRVDDERIQPYRDLSKSLGFDVGQYLSFAEVLSRYLSETYGIGLNGGGFSCAFLLDHGFSAEESYVIFSDCVKCGVMACFQEYWQEPRCSWQPLHCDDIDYCGPAPRKLA